MTRNSSTNAALTVTLVSETNKLAIPASVAVPAGARSAAFNVYTVAPNGPAATTTVSLIASAAGFVSVADTLSIYDDGLPSLSVSVADSIISEGAANPATYGTVAISNVLATSIKVILRSDNARVRVPSVVTIVSNTLSTNFAVTVINNTLVEPPADVALSAFVADGATGSALAATGVTNVITLLDDDGPTLTVALASSTIAQNGTTTGTVSCNTTLTNALVVTLSSGDQTIATVPVSVTIPAGQTSAGFTVQGVDPGNKTGTRHVSITASASAYTEGVAALDVTDIHLPDLAVPAVNVPADSAGGERVTASYVVKNSGLDAATGLWSDAVWYSSSPNGANPVYVGGAIQTNSLAIGESYTNAVSFLSPQSPGAYYLVVTADAGNNITELSEANNTAVSSTTFQVDAPYRATVQADVLAAPSGTAIPMHGHAYYTTNSSTPAAGVTVSIRILVKGTRRVFLATTDANGDFTYLFQPLSTEAGTYQICADHPGVAKDTIQSGFVLYGMGFGDNGTTLTLGPNTNYSGQVLVQNLGDTAVSGVAAVVEGMPSYIQAQVSLTTAISGNASVPLTYTLAVGQVSSTVLVRARIRVSSAEGVLVYYPLTLTIVPPKAILVANPAVLTAPMLVGQQTMVVCDVANVGGADSGPLVLQLPALDWLRASSPTNLDSMAPGQTNRITLLLSPAADLALQQYEGNVYLSGAELGLSVPFKFRATSETTGSLQVSVQDDYTFYVAGAPLVSNALVVLTDPYDYSVVASNRTDSSGIVTLTNLTVGTYQLSVSAASHSAFAQPVIIRAGQTNQMNAFLSRQTVTYQWTVVPTVVQDNYQVVLESVFETEVPIPVVTIDDPLLMPLVVEGEDTQLQIQMSNHGLIAAEQVTLDLPTDDPNYEFQAVVTNVDKIPAMSSISLPVVIRLRTNAVAQASQRLAAVIKPYGATTITGCKTLPKLHVKWGYYCGPDFNWHALETEIIAVPVEHKCADEIKDYLQDQIKKLIQSKGDWKSLLDWKDQLCALLAMLAGCSDDECLVSVVGMGCGVASGSLSASIGPATRFGNCWCPNLPSLSFSVPSSPETVDPNVEVGGGVSTSCGGGITDPYTTPIEWTYSGCTPGDTTGSSEAKVSRAVLYSSSATVTPQDKSTSPGAVCAQVRIRLEQEAVVARAGFAGTLELDNGDTTYPLTGVRVTLNIQDSSGNPANNLFGVTGPVLTGLTGTDGTGVVAAGSSGVAKYTFVPTHLAAPTTATQYSIGGTLEYAQAGSMVQVPLIAQVITVFPDPVLHLLYFQQRDVYGDDPFTPEIEPSEAFDVGLMVTNSGYGKALSFSITSGQPEIVDNEKGLLIDFTLLGTQVGTNSFTPSLTANLGEIDPGKAQTAVWKMVSSLQGKFIEYQATFRHLDDLGNPQTSLIDSVEIHELIHTVLANRTNDDAVPDFLVNDISDPDNLPEHALSERRFGGPGDGCRRRRNRWRSQRRPSSGQPRSHSHRWLELSPGARPRRRVSVEASGAL